MKLLGRLLKLGGKKAVKPTVKKVTKSSTTAARRRALVEKARKAAKTTVQTNPKVGPKAVLKGKEVYWGGKNWGWQSKDSLTKITGDKPKARVTGKPQKPKYASAPPKKGTAASGTRDSANGTKTLAARGRSGAKARERLAAKRTKPRTDNRFRTDPETGSRIAVGNPTKKPKVVSRTTKTPSKAPATPKGRPTTKPPLNKTPAKTVTTGKKVPAGTLKGKRLGPTSKTAKATNPSSTPRGVVQENSRKFGRRLNKKYLNKERARIKNDTAKATEGMNAAQRQKWKEQQTAAMNKKGRRVRELAERKATRSQLRDRFNASPSNSSQDPYATSGVWRNRITDAKAKAMSEDMTTRRSGKAIRGKGELVQSPKGTSKTGDSRPNIKGPGKKAATRNGLKIGDASKGKARATKPRTKTDSGKSVGGDPLASHTAQINADKRYGTSKNLNTRVPESAADKAAKARDAKSTAALARRNAAQTAKSKANRSSIPSKQQNAMKASRADRKAYQSASPAERRDMLKQFNSYANKERNRRSPTAQKRAKDTMTSVRSRRETAKRALR